MIGNSSAGVRETSIYGIPAIDVGTRQKGRYSTEYSQNIQHVSEDKDEILQAIEVEIEKLPPRTREVLKSVYIDGLSYRETADRFSISIATVKTLLVNALKYLRKVFSGFWHFRFE